MRWSHTWNIQNCNEPQLLTWPWKQWLLASTWLLWKQCEHLWIWNFLEDCGAEDIIKGFYYKENGNAAICYDFNADGTRFVLDNEIQVCSGNYYSLNVRSRLSVYKGDFVYRTEYLSGMDYVMDYRSPMWVDRRIFNILHDIMNDIKEGSYSHSECPFANLGIAHYEENGNWYETWHDDAYGY